MLKILDLKVHFPISGGRLFQKKIGIVRAVDGVTLEIPKGKTFGLVGESGCGKTTIARAILGILSHKAEVSGQILFREKVLDFERGGLDLRKTIQVIFQDPALSSNPRMSILDIVAEGIDIHHLATSRKEREDRVEELLRLVDIDPGRMDYFPGEFSAGQRQRISIARALAVEPSFLVLDEPVSSLDVSLQRQVLNLLLDLKSQFGLTYLFISHDLAVVSTIADMVGVMHEGKIVEQEATDVLYASPQHPYTRTLLDAVPIADPKRARARKKERL